MYQCGVIKATVDWILTFIHEFFLVENNTTINQWNNRQFMQQTSLIFESIHQSLVKAFIQMFWNGITNRKLSYCFFFKIKLIYIVFDQLFLSLVNLYPSHSTYAKYHPIKSNVKINGRNWIDDVSGNTSSPDQVKNSAGTSNWSGIHSVNLCVKTIPIHNPDHDSPDSNVMHIKSRFSSDVFTYTLPFKILLPGVNVVDRELIYIYLEVQETWNL